MGLKITEFKKGGQTFTNAYGKVSNVKYNNDSKIATFGIKVYLSKEDKNLITEIGNQWCSINSGTDIITQCYRKIQTHIEQLKTQITKLETETVAIINNDNLKLRNENMIYQLKSEELLQLENSVEF